MNNFWQQVIFKMGNFSLTPAKLAVVAVAIFITWLFLLLIEKFLVHNSGFSKTEKGARSSVYQLIKYAVWAIAISVCIHVLGFNVTILVAGSAALMVGLGFGLQNIFSDIISGLFILFERKLKAGDIMEVNGIVGKVQTISLRTSVLLTREGYNIIVPNHKFITENVINWTNQAFDRRFYIEVGVSYESDLDKVTAILTDCAMAQKEVLKDESANNKPFVRLQDFGDSSVQFQLIFWTQDIFRVEQVKSEIRYKIFKLFKQNNITIPFPQRDVHIMQ
ncbi:mechanosensitive ion channel [soil metagenome]